MKLATTNWHSSYEKSAFGSIFYSLVRIYKPNTVVELGTKAGYSAYHIASALKDNHRGHLFCYDLWEKYQYSSVPKSTAEQNLKLLSPFVSLNQRNAVGVDKLHTSADILHVDLSNDGYILDTIIPFWIDKTKLIIIEGGSKERDIIDWMVKYNKQPIIPWLKKFSKKYKNFEYFTIETFPSLTLIRKKL